MTGTILPIVIGVVRDLQGRVLLGRRYQPEIPEIHGKWNLLGGRVEFGESPEEALVREIKEESGLEVEVVRMLPQIFTRYRTKSDGTELQILPISYECNVVGGELSVMLDDPGVSELSFFDPESIATIELIENENHIIELALRK